MDNFTELSGTSLVTLAAALSVAISEKLNPEEIDVLRKFFDCIRHKFNNDSECKIKI